MRNAFAFDDPVSQFIVSSNGALVSLSPLADMLYSPCSFVLFPSLAAKHLLESAMEIIITIHFVAPLPSSPPYMRVSLSWFAKNASRLGVSVPPLFFHSQTSFDILFMFSFS